MKQSQYNFILFFIAINFLFFNDVNAQVKACCNSTMRFYQTYNDYLNDKTVPDIQILRDQSGTEGGGHYALNMLFVVNKNGETTDMNMRNYTCFGYSDADTILHRFYEGYNYYVLSKGKICYYVNKRQAYVYTYKDGKMYYLKLINMNFSYYYSDGLNGEIKKIDFDGACSLLSDEPEIFNNLMSELKTINDTKTYTEKQLLKPVVLSKYIQIYDDKKGGL